ncbi:MAG: GMC family oxidoreductase [Ardenticatenaceae bacterium]|nr:GMC family oxidoreductase [Ardenticatenaceae bacterium]
MKNLMVNRDNPSNAQRVIVIGSGPSGAMAAHELLRKGIAVTMLESGQADPQGFLVRIQGRNILRWKPSRIKEGDRHVATGAAQTKWYYNLSAGGLSNDWTGAVPRFSPEDFYEGERLHERYRWPLDYTDLIPYYVKAEQLLDITATPQDVPNLPVGKHKYNHFLPKDWEGVARCAEKRGQGLTIIPLADGPPWMVAKRGTAFNSYTNIIRPLLKNSNFQFITNAHALQLEWSGQKKKVDAVIYHDRNTGSRNRLEGAAFVIACGTLGSTKLLFDSFCTDFPQGLGNSAGILGRYLHDHPKEWWAMDLEKPISPLVPSGYLTRKPYDESTPLLASSWTIGSVFLKDKLLTFVGGKAKVLGVQVFGTMIPVEKYYAKPEANKKDEFGLPLLELKIRFDDEVIKNMESARGHWQSLLDEAGYKGTIQDVAPQLFPGHSVHYGGTVRMHKNPKYGVLDAWNRLHDVPNVVVCDASSFTTGAEKNPTLTAMALSARAMDKLGEDLKTS